MLYNPPLPFPRRTLLKCNQCGEREAEAYDTYEFYVYCQECLDAPREKSPLILGVLVYFSKTAHQVA